jgi:hypothetical protein
LEGGLTIRDRVGTVRDKRSAWDLQVAGKYGDPGAIRTRDPQLRRLFR